MKGKAALGALVILSVVVNAALAGNETGTIGDEEDVDKFEDFEKNFKKGVGNMVKKVLPYLLESNSGGLVSGPCRASIIKVINGVKQLREWAVKFIDATGKIPPGILEGTSTSMGDYDECLGIEVGKKDEPPKKPEDVIFRGQYCLLEAHRPESINRGIKEYQNGNKNTSLAQTKTFLNIFVRYKHLSNSTFKVGVCVPSKCSKQDVENILKSDGLKSIGKITVSHCKQNVKEEISSELILLLCLFSFILVIMVLGTLLDIILRLRKKKNETDSKDNSVYIKYMEQISKNTSLYTNALEVLRTTTQENLKSLCGIRAITVILTIYSHTYGHIHILHFQKFRNAANFIKFFDSFTFSGIANGSVGVDTIFFVAGITITYRRWRYALEKSKVNLNICKLILQRYFRMTAAQVLVICVMLLFPLSGSGPFWDPYMGPELNNCRNKWWLNILFVHNFFKPSKTCLYHTWVLAVIMQLTLLSAILLWVIKKSIRYGIFAMMILTLAGVIGVGVMTIINKLPGSMAFFMLDVRTAPIAWRDVYILPYDHIGPFCIGLLTGYYLGRQKDQLNISRCTSSFMWCMSTACSCAVLLGLYAYRKGGEIDQSLSVFYAIMHRNVWASGIAWLVIACTTHHGGAVKRVLHSGFFVPLDRLCYIAFILHIPIMYYHSGIIRERWFMGHFELLFLGLGYICLSFFGSLLLNIIFVQPYFAVEESVLSYFRTKRKVSFDPKPKFPGMTENENMKTMPEITEAANACVNVAYSKTLDDF